MLHEHKREPVSVTRGFSTASLVAKKTLPSWERGSQSPQKAPHSPAQSRGPRPSPCALPPSLPATSISATPAASQPVPFKVSGKPAEQRKPCSRRASDHRTPHPRRRCLETARIPPTSFPAAVCIGAHQPQLRGSCLGFRNCLYFREAVSQPTLERKSETPPKGVDPSEREKKKGGPRLTSLPTHVTSF